jgi:outer membrane protein insertion porin family
MPNAAEPAPPHQRVERSPPSRFRATSAPGRDNPLYLQLKEGQPYDCGGADRSLKALFATGLFADVVIDMQGSTLVVKVTENPIINRVAFEGNSKIEDDKLRDEVQSKPRQVFTRARAIRRRTHPDHLSPAAIHNASVDPKVIKLDQGRVDLVFEINEGDVTGVQRISFVGNEHFSDGTLRGKIARRSAWYRFLSSDDRYDPDRLNLDRELLRKFYLHGGLCRSVSCPAVASWRPTARLLHHLHDQRGRTLQVRQGRGIHPPGLDVDVLKAI